jgi:hypothetical protein
MPDRSPVGLIVGITEDLHGDITRRSAEEMGLSGDFHPASREIKQERRPT